MKILHFADLHLGVETYGGIDPETGLSSRMLDVLNALDTVVNYALDNRVDLVLFCGDTYKTRDPSQTQQREFAKRLKILSQEGIPVFLLVGNHDLPSAIGRATTLEIFDTLAVKCIYTAGRPDIYCIPTEHGDIQIVALPWLRRSSFLSREESKNLGIDQVNERLQEIMTNRILDLMSDLDPAVPSILAAHVSISTAKTGSEKSMLVGREPVLLLSNIARPPFDYVALGHIHKKQVLCESPPVVYAGSLERLDFGDEGEEKGFYIVDIEYEGNSKNVSYEFHKIDVRRFVTIEIDIGAEDTDPTDTIIGAMVQRQDEIKESIVRIQLLLPRSLESSLHDAEIYKVLKEAYHVTIAKAIKQEPRPGFSQWASEKLTPVEALEIYLETKNFLEDRKKKLLEHAESIIRENTGGSLEDYGDRSYQS